MTKTARELKSWKKIADFLGVSVRTAQKWEEEQSLPVKRHGIGPKARVSILAVDLAAWQQRDQSSDRALPSDITAERRVLATIMVNNETLYLAEETLQPEDFFFESHRMLFAAMSRIIHEHDSAIDIVTLMDDIRRNGSDEQVGGIGYVSSLLDEVPRQFDIAEAVESIRNKAQLRRHISNAKGLLEDWRVGNNPEVLLQRANQTSLAEAKRGLARVNRAATTKWLNKATNTSGLQGLATGFNDLDHLTGGLKPGDLVVFGGTPSAGKTSALINIAHHAATKGGTVAFFSTEMDREQLTLRILCATAMVRLKQVTVGTIGTNDFRRLTDALGGVSKIPLFVEDDPRLTIDMIRAKCLQLRSQQRLDLIIIDSFQMITEESRQSRQDEYARVSKNLKVLARELRVPVIVSAQLPLPERAQRPTLKDLSDAGTLIQDADVITLIFREEMLRAASDNKGAAEFILAKQRLGPRGIIKMAFLEDYGKFENLLEIGAAKQPSRMFRLDTE